jgi:hypothetical protein
MAVMEKSPYTVVLVDAEQNHEFPQSALDGKPLEELRVLVAERNRGRGPRDEKFVIYKNGSEYLNA